MAIDITRTSHTHTHAHTVALLCANDQLVAEAAPCATHNKHNRRILIFSAGFEPTIPAIRRTQNYALDRTAARLGETHFYLLFFRWRLYGLSNHTAAFACSVVHVSSKLDDLYEIWHDSYVKERCLKLVIADVLTSVFTSTTSAKACGVGGTLATLNVVL